MKNKTQKFSFAKNISIKKRGILTIIFAVVFVAVIVLANVLSTSIAQKINTTLDVTTDKSNSLTVENIDFIKNVKYDVEIIVCATREGYTGTEMVNYASSVYYVQENATPDNYFNQTVTLLETYPKYNDKISVKYIDPQSPEFKGLESDNEIDITYGDILVRCTRPDKDNKTKTFESIVTFDELYELYDASSGTGTSMYGYSTYTITASNVETEISSSIFTVSASEYSRILLLSTHSTKDAELALTSALANYNFEVMDMENGVLNADTLKDIDTVLLVSPVSDLSAKELEVLDTFLDNDGKRGKNFVVFGSTSSPATPNLNEFLEEWGIKVNDGMAYDTNPGYRLSDKVSMMLFNKGDDLTKSVNASEMLYYCSDNLALELAYETKGSRTTHRLMTTSPYAVVAPKGVTGYTESSKDVMSEMPVAVVTEDTTMNENHDEVSSYVACFASSDFIASEWEQFSDNGNMEFAISVFNIINGRDSASMYFLPKITGVYSMTTPLSDIAYWFIEAIFMVAMPVLLLIGGVVVWFLRRNR